MSDQNEMETLFPEIEVGQYKVRPWCLGELAELAGCFQRIGEALKTQGITIENIENEMPKVILCLLPEAPRILSVTLKESIPIVNGFDLNKTQLLMLTIINQNLEYLKNSFGLGTILKSMNKNI